MPSSDRPTYINIPKNIREQILNRAEHRCELCGADPEINPYVELNVHHIVARAILEDFIPERQNDPKILVCTCKLCHNRLDANNHYQIKIYKEVQNVQYKSECEADTPHQLSLFELQRSQEYMESDTGVQEQ